jgi:hypothetical protein
MKARLRSFRLGRAALTAKLQSSRGASPSSFRLGRAALTAKLGR